MLNIKDTSKQIVKNLIIFLLLSIKNQVARAKIPNLKYNRLDSNEKRGDSEKNEDIKIKI